MTTPPALAVHGVRVRYGAAEALAGVDLTVGPGERVALVGPSGAGKSTLLRVLSGSVRPSAGSVEVLGRDPHRLGGRDLRRLRRRIGTVNQQLDLTGPMRVVHNVNAGRLGSWSLARSLWSLVHPLGRDEVRAALDGVDLGRHLHARTDQLSGGEQQRVAVARVLVQRPEVLLADEPVSSLDPGLSDRVLALVCGPAPTAPWSVLVSLHEPDLARRHCDRLVGLRDGRVVFDRPAAEVGDALLAALYRSDRT